MVISYRYKAMVIHNMKLYVTECNNQKYFVTVTLLSVINRHKSLFDFLKTF